MANKIIIKKSSVAGKVPLSSDLEVGELAVNLADAALYSKNASGTVIPIGGGGGDVAGPSSATDNALARFDGTTGKLIQNGTVTQDDSGNMANVLSQSFGDGTAQTVAAGKMWYNGTTGSWNMGMGGGNITQQVGEEIFVYGKASAAITEGQVIAKTGTVGASGVITFAPAPIGTTDADSIIGVATENIALNSFGRVTNFGVVHGLDTSAFTNNAILYYDPTVTGGWTATKPSAPNLKLAVATVINAGSGGSGSVQVKLGASSSLGGTDSNVQFGTLSSGNLLVYDATAGYWKNAMLTAGTGIGVTNGAGSVTVSNSGVTSLTGTTNEVDVSASSGAVTISLPATINADTTGNAATATSAGKWTTARTLSFTGDATGSGSVDGSANVATALTLANTAVTAGSYTNTSLTVDAKGRITAASSGTAPVTSVGATAPIASSGGATPTISISQASSTTNGYLSSTDWNTFNNKTSNTGTVTSVAMTVPTGLSVSGTPITTSGTLALTLTAGYSIPTTASQTNWDSAYTQRLQWDGGSTNLVAATGRTSLGGTTVGQNFFTLTNPTAVTFPRINADNTVSALDAATFRTAIGAGTGSGTVTSVTGTSPVTSSGGTTPAISLASAYGDTQNPYGSKTANYILAAPNGVAGAPTFRAMVAADVPTLNQNTTGSAATLTTGRTLAITGDLTWTSPSFNGSANVTAAGTLATVNANVGSFGSSTSIPVVTVNAKGLVTAVSTATVSGGQYFGTAATKAIAYNANSISENITVTAGNNGLSAGPITINTGYTVTVETGAAWVIV